MAGVDRLVAREDLRARLDTILTFGAPPSATRLVGPAGIGKTALWEYAVSRVEAAGWHVLAVRAAASEIALAWVGLTDLLARLDDSVLAELPEPQRDAIRAATLRTSTGPTPPDERTLGTALLATLHRLAASAPVLVALDDAAHLDPASARTLQFALRRLEAQPVHVLATARGGPDSVPDGDQLTLEVGPMSIASLFQLVRDRVGLTFPRPTLVRIHDTSGGNPLYALELARALGRSEIRAEPGTPLELPGSLRSLVADRVAVLDPAVRLLLAAAAASPRLPADGEDATILALAVAQALVVIADGMIRPAHPLVAATAYGSLDPVERAALHRRLASASTDPIERARHLAIAFPEIDPDVAQSLEEGAALAADRGAVEAATDLARLAVSRTADDDPRRLARVEQLASLLFEAGDTAGAAAQQRAAVTLCPPGSVRGRAQIRLAELIVESEGWSAAIPHLQRALADAYDDSELAAEVHLTWSAVCYDDADESYEQAAQAVALLAGIADPDPAILGGALCQAASAQFRAGRGLDHERLLRAIELEQAHPTRRLSDRADAAYAALLKYADELEEADRRFAVLLAEAQSSGDVSSLSYVHSHLPQLALWRGNVAQARELAEQHLALAEAAGMAAQADGARFLCALVATVDGRADGIEATMAADLVAATAAGAAWDTQRLHGVLGMLAWSRGDTVVALGHFDAWCAVLVRIGLREPGYTRYHLDYAEALVSGGRLADARTFLDDLAAKAELSGRGYAHAVVSAGRALVLAAEGDVVGARAEAQAALRRHKTLPLRFDRARCLLILGQVCRRAKAKLSAREALTEALAEFAAMGAAPWHARAAAELARVNIRPAASDELTVTEHRVAELAAAGLTNRQVAERLFLATKTVEANLARVYRKLGIESRAELGARFGGAQAG